MKMKINKCEDIFANKNDLLTLALFFIYFNRLEKCFLCNFIHLLIQKLNN